MRIITCMWWGKAFPPIYVNVLFRAARANLSGDFRFICLTDSGEGLDDGIEVQPIPDLGLPAAAWNNGIWPKVGVFKEGTFPAGSRVLFLDLDTMIIGPLDQFFARSGAFEAIGQDVWNEVRPKKPWFYQSGKKLIKQL